LHEDVLHFVYVKKQYLEHQVKKVMLLLVDLMLNYMV